MTWRLTDDGGALVAECPTMAEAETHAARFAGRPVEFAEVKGEPGLWLPVDPRAPGGDLVLEAPAARVCLCPACFPRVVYQARRVYWEISPGVFQATECANVPPERKNGYRNLAALCRLKGDLPPGAAR